MSRLLSKIMLALLMLPLAAFIYTVTAVLLHSKWGPWNEVHEFLVANFIAGAFVAGYWIALWRGAVKWTSRRLMATGVAGGVVVGVAVILALASKSMLGGVSSSFAVFVGGVTAILLWLVCTIFIWRETSAERLARIRAGGSQTIACPTCGYNLTGLKQTTCPECGSAYTLDELLAAQPSKEPAQLDVE